jgi:hypothetical protein
MIRLRALERFRATQGHEIVEKCQICGIAIGERHRHAVEVAERVLLCACQACSILFAAPGAARSRLRTVPDRVVRDPAFQLTEAQWSALDLPVRLAFFFFHSVLGRWIALYPSPAGATESALALDAWEPIARAPLVQTVEPDVEALLAYGRRAPSNFECLLVPIDACYELVGKIRRSWRGIQGGDAVQHEIEDTFTRLRRRSGPIHRGASGERAAP